MAPLKSEMKVLTQMQPPGFLVHSPARSKQSFSKCRKGFQMWQQLSEAKKKLNKKHFMYSALYCIRAN